MSLRQRSSRTAIMVLVFCFMAPAALGLALLGHRLRHRHRPVPVPAGKPLSTHNITPLARSSAVVGAVWTSPRYDPPKNQQGDILPTIWADDGYQYTMIDDGGTDLPSSQELWRQSIARIAGTPPTISFTHVGGPDDPPPQTWGQIVSNPDTHRGPLGPYYSSGLVEAHGVFYATQENDWNWSANGVFTGLAGIAYSRDHGRHWQSPSNPFPAPLGNLNWVIRGEGGFYPDGWVYAITTPREFNANVLIMGRARPDVRSLTEPARWQWLTGWSKHGTPVFTSKFARSKAVLSWPSHITYPQMVYDAPIDRYLLTFTYSYTSQAPGVWQGGAEFVLAESAHPWGPFSFVAAQPDFGPSNGYGASFPIKWISPNGRDLWLKWAANFDGCNPTLDCSGAYGFNYRRMHLVLAGDR